MDDNLSNAKQIQLGTLLDKMEGIIKTTARTPQSDDDTDDSMRGGKREGICSLLLACTTDFGHASGPMEMQDDGGDNREDTCNVGGVGGAFNKVAMFSSFQVWVVCLLFLVQVVLVLVHMMMVKYSVNRCRSFLLCREEG